MPSLQVKRAPYATLSQAENANSQPAMTGQSDYWLNSIYGLWHGLGHGHENGTPYVIATRIFLSQFIARGCRWYSRLEVSATECLRSQNTRFFATEHFCLETLFDRLCRPRRCWFLAIRLAYKLYVQCFASAYSHKSSVRLGPIVHWVILPIR